MLPIFYHSFYCSFCTNFSFTLALFLPFLNIGLVVIDEENDQSYKQEDGVIYNARDMAILKSKIEKLSWVDSIITIIDVPLLKSSDEPLMERLKNYKTLSYPNIDRNRGFQEILNSPIYRDYVISNDGKTSGVVIYLKKDGWYHTKKT